LPVLLKKYYSGGFTVPEQFLQRLLVEKAFFLVMSFSPTRFFFGKTQP